MKLKLAFAALLVCGLSAILFAPAPALAGDEAATDSGDGTGGGSGQTGDDGTGGGSGDK